MNSRQHSKFILKQFQLMMHKHISLLILKIIKERKKIVFIV